MPSSISRPVPSITSQLYSNLQAAVDIGKLLQINPAAAIKKPSAGDSDIGQALEQERIRTLFGALAASGGPPYSTWRS